MLRTTLLAALVILSVSACDSSEEDPVDLSVRTATDIPADPASRDPDTGQASGTGRFTLYSLRTESVVVAYDATDRADSVSTLWDIGFRGTEVILNGGSSGPGAAVGVVVAEPFGEVDHALDEDYVYRRDGESPCTEGPARAVCTGSGNGWYTYTPFPSGQGGVIVPTAGRTLLIRLADSQGYAKVRVLNYYRGAPDAAAITAESEPRYYTFEYVTNTRGASFDEE